MDSLLFFNYASSKRLNQLSLITIHFSMPFPVHVPKITAQPLSNKIALKIKRFFVPMLQRNWKIRSQQNSYDATLYQSKSYDQERLRSDQTNTTKSNGNIKFILNFIDQLLSKMIHHRISLQVFDTQSASKYWCCSPGRWFCRKLEYPCQVWATEFALVPWASYHTF